MYKRDLSQIKFIVVHHTDTPEDFTVEDIRRIHLGRGWSDIGYHFLVNRAGLHNGRDINFAGAHAIPGKPPYLGMDMNKIAIGLAIIGNFTDRVPDPKLVNETAYALKVLAKKYEIPLDKNHIVGHRNVDFTICPGPYTMEAIWTKLNAKK